MTYINPTLQRTNPPTLQNLLDALAREISKDINCARVGVIQSFSAADQTVTVKIAQQQVTSIAPDGTRTLAEYPLLLKVPVYFPSGGGCTMTFPLATGDECLVIFNDRQLENWRLSGSGLPPTNGRTHDLSDGIAFVGIRSNPRALADVSTTDMQIRSDDGLTYISLTSGKIQLVADEVIIHSRNKLCYDSDGTGTVITPSLITNYTDGVATAHSAPTPPQVPS